jgi:hypothetical protein
LVIDVALALDLELQPLADGIDGAHADAVQTGGDLVARVVELPAGVEDRHHDFSGADLFAELERHLGVLAGRNAATGVFHGHGAVEVDGDFHAVTEAAEMLVDRVVDDLPNEMMEPFSAVHVADVHARPLANGLQTFEDGDALTPVVRGRGALRDG